MSLPSEALVAEIAQEVLLRLREHESLRYCVSRLSDPALDAELRPVIFRLLQQAGLVPQFVEQLLKINPDSAKALAKAFQSFERGPSLLFRDGSSQRS